MTAERGSMKQILTLFLVIAIAIAVFAFVPSVGAASKFETLHRFYDYSNGAHPAAGLAYDPAGNLYGTTTLGSFGRSRGHGDAFELKPNSDGSWTESVIYTFTGALEGSYPLGALTLDSAGNLYGTMSQGGANGDAGLVYELTPNGDGTWTDTVLYNFCSLGNCADGEYPYSSVIFDHSGNLYGTTAIGGTKQLGTVFQLAPNGSKGWTESVIYSFRDSEDGSRPFASLIFDQTGNLYGTASGGGRGVGYGVVFRLSPNQDGSWTHATLYKFCRLQNCHDGGTPYAGLALDSAGNLYGTTRDYGAYGYGNVFELTPNTDGRWSEKVLHQFAGADDGASPQGGVTLAPAGNLYGTTVAGGSSNSCNGGCGVVFKLAQDSKGAWHETVIHALSGSAAVPESTLVFNGSNLYGTSVGNSVGDNLGAVFEVIP
jgi:uncharacterized repeat protein (TIGR03803 family)